jgi:hypothetical protein
VICIRGVERDGSEQRSAGLFGAGVGKNKLKEIGRRLHRDRSIIIRLYSAYAADRDQVTEVRW